MQPTPEQIAELPKWAQEHIADIQRERDIAVRELNRWCDNQTESPFQIMEMVCDGERQGPSIKTRYVQTNHISVKWRGVELEVYACDKDGQRGPGIHVSWSAERQLFSSVPCQPTSHQSLRICTKDDL